MKALSAASADALPGNFDFELQREYGRLLDAKVTSLKCFGAARSANMWCSQPNSNGHAIGEGMPFFSFFADVMGIQQSLLADGQSEGQVLSRKRCADVLEDFRDDVRFVVGTQAEMLSIAGEAKAPSFVAEFSDSAFVLAEEFNTIWRVAVTLVRKAARHGYPLRGGIGFGGFSHNVSSIQSNGEGRVWTTASFHGSAVVTAYVAERASALGQRVFVHPFALSALPESLASRTAPLAEGELSSSAGAELRCWTAEEAQYALDWYQAMRDRQELTARARAHYDATLSSIRRFEQICDDLFIDDGLWLSNLRIQNSVK